MDSAYEIVVIGGGHAGCEAALAAVRMGAKTALLNIKSTTVARMSCNPSIGGIAKSHIVCDLDVLGGEMPRNTDYTGIQFRTLNTKKGPAVQANRVQCDKPLYALRMQKVIENTQNLDLIEGLVSEILIKNDAVKGVLLQDGRKLEAQSVVVTPGTFLGGVIYIGKDATPAGRINEAPANELSEFIKKLGFKLERLKTGTPPRIHKDSINWDKLERQDGLQPPPFFSEVARQDYKMFHVEQKELSRDQLVEMFHVEQWNSALRPWMPGTDQIPCYLSHTTPETHSIIENHLEESALYGGSITGTGVRYCPSIEDKIVKFPGRSGHHVFIEPEGRNNVRVYPNGISNSLPLEIQLEMTHSVPGLENAEFIQPGYGIEYDFSDPRQLTHTLETKLVENLFFAGQINGTTGYEEAAGQGWIAGVNAVLKLRNEAPMVLGRHESYIGVLIDDLVLKGTNEPYRMFTSRAEHRLMLRQGNAFLRLLDHAARIGIVSPSLFKTFQQRKKAVENGLDLVRKVRVEGGTIAELIKKQAVHNKDIIKYTGIDDIDVLEEISVQLKYEGYIQREVDRISRTEKMESIKIPEKLLYHDIKALRFEAREKLEQFRPETLGHASRISGVNPADIAVLSIWIEKNARALQK